MSLQVQKYDWDVSDVMESQVGHSFRCGNVSGEILESLRFWRFQDPARASARAGREWKFRKAIHQVYGMQLVLQTRLASTKFLSKLSLDSSWLTKKLWRKNWMVRVCSVAVKDFSSWFSMISCDPARALELAPESWHHQNPTNSTFFQKMPSECEISIHMGGGSFT